VPVASLAAVVQVAIDHQYLVNPQAAAQAQSHHLLLI
jgi:hypothetical protein